MHQGYSAAKTLQRLPIVLRMQSKLRPARPLVPAITHLPNPISYDSLPEFPPPWPHGLLTAWYMGYVFATPKTIQSTAVSSVIVRWISVNLVKGWTHGRGAVVQWSRVARYVSLYALDLVLLFFFKQKYEINHLISLSADFGSFWASVSFAVNGDYPLTKLMWPFRSGPNSVFKNALKRLIWIEYKSTGSPRHYIDYLVAAGTLAFGCFAGSYSRACLNWDVYPPTYFSSVAPCRHEWPFLPG